MPGVVATLPGSHTDGVEHALAWVAVLVGPTLVVGGAMAVMRVAPRVMGRLRRAREMRPAGPPIERIAADLRRLRRELVALDGQHRPGLATRRRALELAYDDVLRSACQALDVPGADRLTTTSHLAHEIVVVELETRLLAAGLDVASAGQSS